jgi:hypothetical protein
MPSSINHHLARRDVSIGNTNQDTSAFIQHMLEMLDARS